MLHSYNAVVTVGSYFEVSLESDNPLCILTRACVIGLFELVVQSGAAHFPLFGSCINFSFRF